VRFGGGALQVPDMADVEDVEAAVGEGDGTPGGALARDGVDEFGQGEDGHQSRSVDG
jgi:hypothetical protein